MQFLLAGIPMDSEKPCGFEIVEIMAVAHGGSKNDTFVTVERKLTPSP